LVIIRLLIHIS